MSRGCPNGTTIQRELAPTVTCAGNLSEKLALVEVLSAHRERILEYLLGLDVAVLSEEFVRDAWQGFFADATHGRAYQRAVLYVHIPLCCSKCFYCNCESKRALSDREVDRYVVALQREIELCGQVAGSFPFEALYIGGGTPSLLSADQLDSVLSRLFGAFQRGEGFHFGCEMNPESVTRDKALVLRQYGCDRVSFGVQSLTPEVLVRVGRAYQTLEKLTRAVAAVRDAAIPALNLDLVAGLPGETDSSFGETVRQCLRLVPDSMVVYRWFVDLTPMFDYGFSLDSGNIVRREELLRVAAEVIAAERPAIPHPARTDADTYATGYAWSERPEVLNLYESLRQDHAATVLGLGYGAESHIHGRLTHNYVRDFRAYLEALERGVLPAVVGKSLTPEFEMSCFVANTLDRAGLSGARFREVFGVSPTDAFPEEFAFLTREGFAIPQDGNWVRSEQIGSKGLMASAIFFTVAELSRCLEQIGPARDASIRAPRHPAAADAGREPVLVRLSRSCNCACRTCLWTDDMNGGAFPTDEILSQVRTAAGRHGGRLALVGGEPTIDRRFLRVIRAARDAGCTEITAWTNGRHFSYPQFVQAALAAGLSGVVVSLHGPSALLHDAQTRVPGSFEQTIAGLRLLLRFPRFRLVARLVVDHDKLHQLPDTLEMVADLGLTEVLLDVLDPFRSEVMANAHQVVSARGLAIRTFRRHGSPEM